MLDKEKHRESSFGLWFIAFIIAFFIAMLFMSLNVHAEEKSTSDYTVDDRVNFLEIRLE